jgi:hypothetical protein
MGAVRIFDKTVFRSQAELGNEGERKKVPGAGFRALPKVPIPSGG